jgi:hypothetical protein
MTLLAGGDLVHDVVIHVRRFRVEWKGGYVLIRRRSGERR